MTIPRLLLREWKERRRGCRGGGGGRGIGPAELLWALSCLLILTDPTMFIDGVGPL